MEGPQFCTSFIGVTAWKMWRTGATDDYHFHHDEQWKTARNMSKGVIQDVIPQQTMLIYDNTEYKRPGHRFLGVHIPPSPKHARIVSLVLHQAHPLSSASKKTTVPALPPSARERQPQRIRTVSLSHSRTGIYSEKLSFLIQCLSIEVCCAVTQVQWLISPNSPDVHVTFSLRMHNNRNSRCCIVLRHCFQYTFVSINGKEQNTHLYQWKAWEKASLRESEWLCLRELWEIVNLPPECSITKENSLLSKVIHKARETLLSEMFC